MKIIFGIWCLALFGLCFAEWHDHHEVSAETRQHDDLVIQLAAQDAADKIMVQVKKATDKAYASGYGQAAIDTCGNMTSQTPYSVLTICHDLLNRAKKINGVPEQ